MQKDLVRESPTTFIKDIANLPVRLQAWRIRTLSPMLVTPSPRHSSSVKKPTAMGSIYEIEPDKVIGKYCSYGDMREKLLIENREKWDATMQTTIQ